MQRLRNELIAGKCTCRYELHEGLLTIDDDYVDTMHCNKDIAHPVKSRVAVLCRNSSAVGEGGRIFLLPHEFLVPYDLPQFKGIKGGYTE